MARHFREDVERTEVATRRREVAGARARDMQVSIERQARPRTVRRDDYYYDYGHPDEGLSARGGICALGRGVFLLLAWLVRIVALAVCVLVLLTVIPILPIKYHVAYATELLTSYLPWSAWGTLAVDTPFGGVFRCDLCLLSMGLFVFDWVLCRIRAALV